MVNLEKHIWEGWTVGDFVEELKVPLNTIQRGNSWKEPLKTREELKKWCMENQPYYKKYIKEVVDYFSKLYNIK